MWGYRIFYAFDALAVLVLAYFFLDGLRHATDSGDFIIWLPLLGVPIAILVAAPVLRKRGQNVAAIALLVLLAVPALFFVLFFGLMIALHPRWN